MGRNSIPKNQKKYITSETETENEFKGKVSNSNSSFRSAWPTPTLLERKHQSKSNQISFPAQSQRQNHLVICHDGRIPHFPRHGPVLLRSPRLLLDSPRVQRTAEPEARRQQRKANPKLLQT